MPDERIEATAKVNGAELHYEIDGAGEPLLLLHGGTGCHGDWVYAGREHLVREYQIIAPDARGHGRSTNPQNTITHRQCAFDTLALLDHLGIKRCKAIGVSMGGNVLLHMATLQPERIEAMVIVSATMYFPEQAREIMLAVPPPDSQPVSQWDAMRQRHHLGDEQIRALWEWAHALKDSRDEMNFMPADLAAIRARALIVQGDRDPLYPVEMSVEMYRAITNSALWIVPNGGHGPVFFDAAPQFAQTAIAFLRT
jgi:pimeloyl-ACP methyl ester carboxylesterase